ncbi:plasmid mobilization protein [Flavobacterium sp. GT3P67]|uniref:plasmid mobilization protein n=1 Tax=Flavobacterium sp. GT3P67 TaxID=2541722 RepID=UPI00267C6891|nr:plasmid mobilization relaxosome protein MobC [Flavobacterium sp. GT3P67]
MMEEQNNNRTKWLHLRLTPDEYQKIVKEFNKSTCRKLSDYSRKNLLQKPIVNKYRNQSLDDFMAEMISLRTELNAIGNNFNQAVKKLHTLQQISDFKHWLISYELEKKILFNKVGEIKKHIQKFAESWLQ